jgi:hypothetical protein
VSGRRPTLLDTVRGLLERTYGVEAPLGDLAPFVIGDEGYRRLYGGRACSTSVGSGDTLARTLVRETEDGLRACIYYPDRMIARLEAHPPWRGVGEENVEAFAVLVEELDHLLCIATRAAAGRTCSLFELELHANVSKELVLSRFLAAGRARRRPSVAERVWLRWHLFHKGTWSDPEAGVRERYHEAARWALRFLDGLERLPRREARLASLRRFHGATAGEKLELIRSLAAA